MTKGRVTLSLLVLGPVFYPQNFATLVNNQQSVERAQHKSPSLELTVPAPLSQRRMAWMTIWPYRLFYPVSQPQSNKTQCIFTAACLCEALP